MAKVQVLNICCLKEKELLWYGLARHRQIFGSQALKLRHIDIAHKMLFVN